MRHAPDRSPPPWHPRPPDPPDRTALLAGAAAIRSPTPIRVRILQIPLHEQPQTATTDSAPARAPTPALLPPARPAATNGKVRSRRPTTPPWPPAAPRPNGRLALLASVACLPIPASVEIPSPKDRTLPQTPAAASTSSDRGPNPDTSQALPPPTSAPAPEAPATHVTHPDDDRSDDAAAQAASQDAPSETPPPARTDDGPVASTSHVPSAPGGTDLPEPPPKDPSPPTEPPRPLLTPARRLLAQVADEIAALEARAAAADADAARMRDAIEQHRILADSLLHQAETERDRACADADRLVQERQVLLARIETLEQALEQRRAQAQPCLPLPFPTDWQDVPDWCETAFPGRIAFTKHTRRLIRSANPGDLYDDVPRAVFLFAWMAGPLRDQLLANIPLGDGGPIPEHPGFHHVRTGTDADVQEYAYEDLHLRAEWHVKNGNGERDQRRMLRIYCAWLPDRRLIVICRAPRHVENAIS